MTRAVFAKAAALSAAALIVLAAALVAFPSQQAEAAGLPAPDGVRAARHGGHGIALRWRAVEGAKSYAVYRKTSRGKSYRKLGVTRATRLLDPGLASDKTYRYKVAACARRGGKGAGKRSYAVAARAYSKGASKVNPGAPKLKARGITLAVARAASPGTHGELGDVGLAPKVPPSVFGKKVGARGCRAFSTALRWASSNPSVLQVAGSGVQTTVRALRAGQATLRARAANGATSAVRVIVTDPVVPDAFTDPGLADPEVVRYMNDEREAVGFVAHESLRAGVSCGAWLDEDGGLCGAAEAALAKAPALRTAVVELLTHSVDGVRPAAVRVDGAVRIEFSSDVIEDLVYRVSYDPWDPSYGIAPYWHVRSLST